MFHGLPHRDAATYSWLFVSKDARCRLQAISASMYRRLICRTTYRVPLQWPRTGSMSRVIGWTCHTAPSC